MTIEEIMEAVLYEIVSKVNSTIDEQLDKYERDGVNKYEVLTGLVDELDQDHNILTEEVLEHINSIMMKDEVLP